MILREPLLHFFVLGAAVFGLFALAGGKQVDEPARIIVSTAQIANLQDRFARTWQRPPTEQETRGLIEEFIRDEVFYREGRALGLDRDDIIVRRRLRQKMEFMVEDMAAAEPTDDDLRSYLTFHSDKFRTEERLTFRHVFLSARRAASLDNDARRVAAGLSGAHSDIDPSSLGDPFLHGEGFRGMTRRDVAGAFGDGFAEHLFAMEQDRWQGPVRSTYGLHFVFLEDRTPEALPQLDAVRAAVRREVMNARRITAEETLYRTLRQRYAISVQTAPPARAAQTESVGAVR
jgi:hypothetical protein